MNKCYLGDSVYAEKVDGMIRLTTENGFGPSNEIFLEDFVLSALISFSKKPSTIQKHKDVHENGDNA